MDIPNPDKFQMATTVIKNSRSKNSKYAAGITSNRRLLVIKRGHLYYYSNIPKSFRGDPKALNSFHQLPKCSIDIANIKQIKAYETSSEFFSIQFEAKHMMERDDIRKTLTLEDYNFAPKNTKQIIKWQFTCDNQYIKQKWVNALQTLHTHYNKEKVNIQKYFDNVNKKQDEINLPQRNSSSLPWRQDQLRKSTASNEGRKFMKKNDEIGIGLSFLPKQNQSNSSVSSFKGRDTQQISQDLFIKQQPEKINQQNSKFRPMSLPKQEQPIKIQTKPLQEKIQKIQLPENTKKTKSTPNDIIHEIIKEEPSKQDAQTPLIVPQQRVQKSPIQSKTPSPPRNQKNSPQAIKIQQPEQPEQIEQIQPLQLQKSRKQSSKVPSKKNTESKQQLQPQINDSIFKLLENCQSFPEKINNQRQFHHIYHEFCNKVKNYLLSLMEKKLISTHQDLYVHENFILKIGLVTTQNLVVASKELIFYNEDKIKVLKTQFNMYDRLFSEFVKNAKKKTQDRNRVRLRVPLAVLIQYKGVIGLAIEDQQTWQALENQNQIRDDRDYLYSIGFDPNNFYFKKSFSEPYRIALIKKPQKIQEKHHNVSFQPPIYHTFLLKAKQQNASTSLPSLEKYSKTLKLISNFEGVCPKQEIINALQLCIFCKKIRKIYRSTHGEVQAKHFFNLIFNRDVSILPLLKQSNCDYIPHISGQLLDFMEYYFGITFQLDQKKLENAYKEKDIILDAHCQPKIKFFDNRNLEVFQAINMIDKYFLDEDAGLLKQTIKIKQVLYQNIQQKQSKQDFLKQLELQKNRAELSYLQSDYIQSIHQCKEYISKCQQQIGKFAGSSKYTLLKFPIFILMIKVYAHFSEIEMSKTIKECYDLLVFNFGQDHSSFVNLWVLGSFFYLNNFNNFQMAERLGLSALQLTEKLFGVNSRQRGQMLLDLSKIYRKNRNEIQKSQRLFQISLQILSSNGTDSDYILLKNEQMNRILLKDNNEAIQNLLTELLQFQEKIKNKSNKKNLKDVYKMQFEVASTLVDFEIISNIVEKMWNVGLEFKQLSIANAYKLAVMQITQDVTTKAYTQFMKFLSIYSDISQMLSIRAIENGSNAQEKFTKQSAMSLITYKLSQSMSLRLVQVIWQLIQQHDRQQVQALIVIIGSQDMTNIHSKYVR